MFESKATTSIPKGGGLSSKLFYWRCSCSEILSEVTTWVIQLYCYHSNIGIINWEKKLWRQREVCHVVTSERSLPCCDVREKFAMLWRQKFAILWRQREVRHVMTSERSSPCCDVREKFAMLWRQREVRHVVTSERSSPCCDVREKFTMLWRQRNSPCCDVGNVPQFLGGVNKVLLS